MVSVLVRANLCERFCASDSVQEILGQRSADNMNKANIISCGIYIRDSPEFCDYVALFPVTIQHDRIPLPNACREKQKEKKKKKRE